MAKFVHLGLGCAMQAEELFKKRFESRFPFEIQRRSDRWSNSWQTSNNGCAVIRQIAPALKKYGLNMSLGRILTTMMFGHHKNTSELVEYTGSWCARGVQWEEAFLDAPSIPESTSLQGRRQPMRTKDVMSPGAWHIARSDLNESFNGTDKHPVSLIHGLRAHWTMWM